MDKEGKELLWLYAKVMTAMLVASLATMATVLTVPIEGGTERTDCYDNKNNKIEGITCLEVKEGFESVKEREKYFSASIIASIILFALINLIFAIIWINKVIANEDKEGEIEYG